LEKSDKRRNKTEERKDMNGAQRETSPDTLPIVRSAKESGVWR